MEKKLNWSRTLCQPEWQPVPKGDVLVHLPAESDGYRFSTVGLSTTPRQHRLGLP